MSEEVINPRKKVMLSKGWVFEPYPSFFMENDVIYDPKADRYITILITGREDEIKEKNVFELLNKKGCELYRVKKK